jgi:hypothetical protein
MKARVKPNKSSTPPWGMVMDMKQISIGILFLANYDV